MFSSRKVPKKKKTLRLCLVPEEFEEKFEREKK